MKLAASIAKRGPRSFDSGSAAKAPISELLEASCHSNSAILVFLNDSVYSKAPMCTSKKALLVATHCVLSTTLHP